MTVYLVELYTPTKAWYNLSGSQREAFFDNIRAALPILAEAGVEPLTLSRVDPETDFSVAEVYVGIWRFPNQAARISLLESIAESGWYNYFDHRNAAVGDQDFSHHMSDLIAL